MDCRKYIDWTDERVAAMDIAELNLSLAEGLPQADDLDCLPTLNQWAEQIRTTTERNLPRYRRAPQEFEHSEAKFRMLCFKTVLQRDLGVTYNMAFAEGAYNATDSRNLFIHGPLTGFGGTCVNLPILYLALGRRLGYPLSLVLAKEHAFVRWTDHSGERFNIETTSPGFMPWGDEHYHEHPRPLTAAEIVSGVFLRDLKPREELAYQLNARGYVAMDNMMLRECLLAFGAAAHLDRRYEPDWASATIANEIFGQLAKNFCGDWPPLDRFLEQEIVRASPPAKEQWQRWASPMAMQHVERILRHYAPKHLSPLNRLYETTSCTIIA